MNLQNLDFTPLWITMKTGVAATFVSFFLGIFAARFVMGRKGKARAFWDGFLTMPLVLPPTVADTFCISYIQYKKTVWPFSGEQSWHSGSTYLAWLCAGGNGHRFSADVPQCESGL